MICGLRVDVIFNSFDVSGLVLVVNVDRMLFRIFGGSWVSVVCVFVMVFVLVVWVVVVVVVGLVGLVFCMGGVNGGNVDVVVDVFL